MKLYPILLEIIKNHDSFWITPDGKFHSTDWQQHIQYLVDNVDSILSKEEKEDLFATEGDPKDKNASQIKYSNLSRKLYDLAFEKGMIRLVAQKTGSIYDVNIEHGKKIDRTAMTATLEYVIDNLQYISKLWIEENSIAGKVRIFNLKKDDDNNNADSFFNDYARYLR